MSDVILKNQAGYEETYDNIDELRTTTASGTGEQTFVIPPIVQYDLINSNSLISPPYNKPENDTDWSIALSAFGSLGKGDINLYMNGIFPVENKTTLPIIYLMTNNVVNDTDNSKNKMFVYISESITGAVLNEILRVTEGSISDYTPVIGWNKLLLDSESKVTSCESVESGTVTINVKQPCEISDSNTFYKILSESTTKDVTDTIVSNGEYTYTPTEGSSAIRSLSIDVNVPGETLQDEKNVSITSNGSTEVTPDENYDGIRKLTIQTNVEGGGSNVIPDYNQNDPSAQDYIKNRPGGYYIPSSESVTLTFDGNTEGKDIVDATLMFGDGSDGRQYLFVKVSDLVFYKTQLSHTKVTVMQGEESIVEIISDGSIQKIGELVMGIEDYPCFISCPIDNYDVGEAVGEGSGLLVVPSKGTYLFGVYTTSEETTTAMMYTSQIVTPEFYGGYESFPAEVMAIPQASYSTYGGFKIPSGSTVSDYYVNPTIDDSTGYIKISPDAFHSWVRYDKSSYLTEEQKKVARDNIGALGSTNGSLKIDSVTINNNGIDVPTYSSTDSAATISHFRGAISVGVSNKFESRTTSGSTGNYITMRNALVVGDINKIHSQNTATIGSSNEIHSDISLIVGNNNYIYSDRYKAMIGYNLRVDATDYAFDPQLYIGKYNSPSKAAIVVGNGNGTDNKSNCFEVDYNGLVTASGIILKSSTEGSTKKFKITVGDDGTLTTSEIT